MKRLSLILFAVFIFIILDLHNMCAEMERRRDRKIIIDINARGKKIEMNVGDEIRIELKSLGATGYKWYFSELDHDFLELIGEETKVLNMAKEDIGSGPVIGIWKLGARRQGITRIKMLHYRIWEGKDKSIDQFEIEVQINQ